MMHQEKLLEDLASGQDVNARRLALDLFVRSVDSPVIEGATLSGHDLSELDLRAVTFRACDFRGALVAECALGIVDRCDLDHQILRRVSIDRVSLCTFRHSLMESVRFGFRCHACNFDNAFLIGCSMQEGPDDVLDRGGHSFRHARLHGFDAAGACLTRSDFSECSFLAARLSRVDFTHSRFNATSFAGCNLALARFDQLKRGGLGFENCVVCSDDVVAAAAGAVCVNLQSVAAQLDHATADMQTHVPLRLSAVMCSSLRGVLEELVLFRESDDRRLAYAFIPGTDRVTRCYLADNRYISPALAVASDFCMSRVLRTKVSRMALSPDRDWLGWVDVVPENSLWCKRLEAVLPAAELDLRIIIS
jgi:uncharacterized protein YjbI with pentapeptide repeats